jgi:hypothetical protein
MDLEDQIYEGSKGSSRVQAEYDDYLVKGPVKYGPQKVNFSVPITFVGRSEKAARGKMGQDYVAINRAYRWGLKNRNHLIGNLRVISPELGSFAKLVQNRLRKGDNCILGIPIVLASKIILLPDGDWHIPTGGNQYNELRVGKEYKMPKGFVGGKILRYEYTKLDGSIGGMWRLGWESMTDGTEFN